MKIIKKIIFAVIMLYSFNLIAVKFGVIIPINYITILLITMLDIPAVALLLFTLMLVF